MALRKTTIAIIAVLCLGLAALLPAACRTDPGDDSAKIFQAIGAKDGVALSQLLGKHQDFTKTNGAGETYLGFAVAEDYVTGVSLLVAAHAPVNDGNAAGETPLRQAIAKRNIAIVSLLLEAGAAPDAAGLDLASANRDIDVEIIALLNGPENAAAPDAGGRQRHAPAAVYVREGLSAAERERLKKEIEADLLKTLEPEAGAPDAKILRLRDIIDEEKK